MVDEDADEDGTDDRPECEYGIDCYRNGRLLWKNCSFRYQGEVFHCRENRQHLRDFKHTKKQFVMTFFRVFSFIKVRKLSILA